MLSKFKYGALAALTFSDHPFSSLHSRTDHSDNRARGNGATE